MRGIHLLTASADKQYVVRGTFLRHLRPAHFRRGRKRTGVDALTLEIAALVAERQRLRQAGAGPAELERNRLEIARAQWELAHALIDRHLAQPAA